MRYFYYLILVFCFGFGKGQLAGSSEQCTISGPSSISVGQVGTYTINKTAQCSQCYDWDILTGASNAQIVGNNDMNQTVQILATNPGTFSLNTTYFDESGCHTCSYSGGGVITVTEYCCPPEFFTSYVCRPNGTGHGAISFRNNSTCTVNWSNIASIEIEFVNGAYFTNGPYQWQTSGIFYSPAEYDSYNFHSPICVENQSIAINVDVNFVDGNCLSLHFDLHVDPDGSLKNDIELFPNPVENVINFKGNNLNSMYFSLIDNNGKVLLDKIKIREKIDVSKFKSGKYYYVIFDGNEKIKNGELIIK